MSKTKKYLAETVGRRKTSVARVYLTKGQGAGKIIVNNREFKEYFQRKTGQMLALQPLTLLKVSGDYDIKINVTGGGITGQAGAVRLGIARALEAAISGSRGELKKAGLLRRDSRKVERKKYGLAGARKSFQFSKR